MIDFLHNCVLKPPGVLLRSALISTEGLQTTAELNWTQTENWKASRRVAILKKRRILQVTKDPLVFSAAFSAQNRC